MCFFSFRTLGNQSLAAGGGGGGDGLLNDATVVTVFKNRAGLETRCAMCALRLFPSPMCCSCTSSYMLCTCSHNGGTGIRFVLAGWMWMRGQG